MPEPAPLVSHLSETGGLHTLTPDEITRFNILVHDFKEPQGALYIAYSGLLQTLKGKVPDLHKVIVNDDDLKDIWNVCFLANIKLDRDGSHKFRSGPFQRVHMMEHKTEVAAFAKANNLKLPNTQTKSMAELRKDIYLQLAAKLGNSLEDERLIAFITNPRPHTREDTEYFFINMLRITKEKLRLLQTKFQGLSDYVPDEDVLKVAFQDISDMAEQSVIEIDSGWAFFKFLDSTPEEILGERTEMSLAKEIGTIARIGKLSTGQEKKVVVTIPHPTTVKLHPVTRKMWLNIITNAVKYSKNIVIVHAENVSGNLSVSVTDDGKGILPTDLQRIFEKGVQGEDALESTGLGLWKAKTIAEKLGGRIEVESTPGKGSTFRTITPLN